MKTCLFRYITTILTQSEQSLTGHNAKWKSWTIFHLLQGLGYQMECINWKNNGFTITHAYDVVFDIIALPELSKGFDDNTVKIFMLTGSDNVDRNIRALGRVDQVNERRNSKLKYSRYISDPEKVYQSIELADHVLITGNEASKRTYPERYWDKINLVNVTSANAWGLV